MKYKTVPWQDYLALWEQCKLNMRFHAANIDPILKTMTAQGLSGEGTDFANEYDRLVHSYYNPQMPKKINWIDHDGECEIVPKNSL